ncbi:Ceacam10 [Phodopus roborovskii]|uniref:Ceacam10 protein n=1 Tax=Phodopus roborovskii TaxID=109678 RepID=A0AAV0A9S9_PHORO|nr:Ceacam10 [Phodopus roborovskii]
MELTSAPLHKGQLPWRGLLLAASLLTYWNSPATAQVTVEAVPPLVAEGANILLQVRNLLESPQVFYWHKGDSVYESNEIARFITFMSKNKTGPAYSGRERIYQNGSLLLQNVTQKDAGIYMLHMITKNFAFMTESVQVHVHPKYTTYWNVPTTAKVTVEAVPPHVAEGNSILLLVHNLPATVQTVYWYKGQSVNRRHEIAGFLISKGRNETGPAYSGRETVFRSGSLLFRNVTLKDAGPYLLRMIIANFDARLSVNFQWRKQQ